MRLKTFVVSVEHLDEHYLGYATTVKHVLTSEFFSGPIDGERMCRIVCEVR